MVGTNQRVGAGIQALHHGTVHAVMAMGRIGAPVVAGDHALGFDLVDEEIEFLARVRVLMAGVDVHPVEVVIGHVPEQRAIVGDVHEHALRFDLALEILQDGDDRIDGVPVAPAPMPFGSHQVPRIDEMKPRRLGGVEQRAREPALKNSQLGADSSPWNPGRQHRGPRGIALPLVLHPPLEQMLLA